MDGFFSLIRFMVGCGILLLLVMVVLAHMPKSPLRTLLVQVSGWAGAAFCGMYALSPVDVMPEALLGPFGLPDDVLAVVIGIMSAISAWKAGKERAAAKEAESNVDDQLRAA